LACNGTSACTCGVIWSKPDPGRTGP
jgi:hypothetical protein